ncbi:MAG: hypothetical protein ACXWMU_01545 [Candidatus Limnocylindrales bacterium]
MDERGWRTVALGLGAVVVLLVVAVGIVLIGGDGTGPTDAAATPPPVASPTAVASLTTVAIPTAAATPSATAAPSSAPPTFPPVTAAPSLAPSALAAVSPTPSGPQASVTFIQFKLDAAADPAGRVRTFTFTTDGLGQIQAKLSHSSPLGQTTMCIQTGALAPFCRTWAGGTLLDDTKTAHDTWRVTLIGADIATPTVDLTLTWPTTHPGVTLTNGRFQATGTVGGYNGLVARLSPGSSGTLTVTASWDSGHPYPGRLEVNDLTSGTSLPPVTPAAGAPINASMPVGPDLWEIRLYDTSGLDPGGAGPLLTASLAWP